MSSALIGRAPIRSRSDSLVLRRADLMALGIIAALTLATFLLRLSQMHQSLFGDEVWTYQDITGRGLLGVIRNTIPNLSLGAAGPVFITRFPDVLAKYAALVSSASEGAVTQPQPLWMVIGPLPVPASPPVPASGGAVVPQLEVSAVRLAKV